MPLHRVAGWDCVPSMDGLAPTGLHRPKGPHHRAFRGGGRKRRRSQQVPHHASHRPRGGTGGPLNDAHHHWSKGPTPGTNGVSDRAITTSFTDLTDVCRTTTTGTSIHRSRPVGLRYTTGSVESVRQPGTPVIRPLCCPVWQRPCA
jgi:hypothetical protein